MYPLFEAAPHALTVIAITGAFTAVFAATMGMVMTDIKRVLAYSTISQLGLMMLGLATGGVFTGIFYLFNHAFFKALLFLGAGSINHATGTLDMREMGGLRKKIPWTFACFTLAALSLAGIWPMSGFFSKEGVLSSALDKQPLLFGLAIITTFLTAFYIFRVVFLIFGGQYRGSHEPHESPRTMLLPMVLLAIPAVASGWLNANGGFEALLDGGATHAFLKGIFGLLAHPLAWVSLLAAGSGIFTAYATYIRAWISPDRIKEKFHVLYIIFSHKYWMDELYDLISKSLLYRGIFKAFAWFDTFVIDGAVNGLVTLTAGKHGLFSAFRWFDTVVIDGAVNGLATLIGGAGRLVRKAQTGQLQLYGLLIIFGVLAVVLAMVFSR
jgi:NADH-quinone oxidoreductase subunit L